MDEMVLECKTRMGKSLESLQAQLVTLRTGRASAALLNHIEIDYYGSPMPINQIASISSPEPRQLLIKPYDKGDIRSILAALNESDLGINPINDGTSIRLIFPALTEERRKELVKTAKKYGEDAKIAIRNIRRDYMDFIKSDKETPEDMRHRLEENIQKETDAAIRSVDDIIATKEKEIMAI